LMFSKFFWSIVFVLEQKQLRRSFIWITPCKRSAARGESNPKLTGTP
jgi:hypothetical protein